MANSPAADGTEFRVPADGGLSFRVPDMMHSLALDLSPEDRAEHIRDVAGRVWAAGTDFQRETTAEMYGEIADAAAEDGALYAGVCFLALDDGRPASASLVVRAEDTDQTDADIVATGIAEGLSTQPGREAYRTNAAGRPVTVAFSVVNSPLDVNSEDNATAAEAVRDTRRAASIESGAPDSAVLTVATAEAYVPLPEISRLLVLCVSTPSLEIFPDVVALLSGITETLEVDAAGLTATSAVLGAAGTLGGAPRLSRISGL
ncbi:hypothetical protein [Streptomyces sp. DW26H14]|uniref:hypothetical protein n=1 Tax=Streptomyces sp. DW26H14 TaxID=3435395 RepID=UPI00403D86D2